jgi:glycosyltransferase involved in cell wall biosynthesis
MSPERPRILFVDHVSKVLGGAEVNLLELLALPDARTRWDVSVACAPGSPLAAALAKLDVPCHTYGFAPALNELRVVGRSFNPVAKLRGWQELQRATGRLREIVAGVRPDVLLSCANKDHFTAGAVAADTGRPSVWWVNDILSAEFFSWPVRRVFVVKARKLATRLTPVSDFGRAALIAEGLPAGRIVTIHNGIPVGRYRPSESTLLRERLRIAPGEPLFGLVGRITPWKGQDLFLRLAAEWAEAGRPGRFVIIGRAFNEDEPFEVSLREFVRYHRLESRVDFVAFQADIAATLSQLDVLLHCSTKPEPFGRVLIEAMAVGVPVIGARAGGVPEILTDGVDGLLAAPGSTADYLRHMVTLAGDRARGAELAAAGRRTVERRFTLERVFADFDRVIGEVLSSPSPGG